MSRNQKREAARRTSFNVEAFQYEVGMRLGLARRVREMNQAELAKALNVSRPQLANMEGGRSRLFADQIFRAAQILGIPASRLMPPTKRMQVDLHENDDAD